MPGETVDGGDPVAVHEAVVDGGRARPLGRRARRSSSRSSTASPRTATSSPRPACRCTSRSTRRSPSSATPRSTRRRKRGDPVPRFRARLVQDGTLAAEDADRIAEEARAEMQEAVDVRAREPVPARRGGHRLRLRLRRIEMARELPYIAAIGEAIHQEMERDDVGPLLRPEHRHHRRRPVPEGVRLRPRPRDADLRDRRDRDGGRRGDRRLPAGRRAVHGRVHARRDGPGRERGEPLPLHVGRPGEGADRPPGRLRVHRRLGRAAHRDDLRDVHGRARPEGRAARRRPPTRRA